MTSHVTNTEGPELLCLTILGPVSWAEVQGTDPPRLYLFDLLFVTVFFLPESLLSFSPSFLDDWHPFTTCLSMHVSGHTGNFTICCFTGCYVPDHFLGGKSSARELCDGNLQGLNGLTFGPHLAEGKAQDIVFVQYLYSFTAFDMFCSYLGAMATGNYCDSIPYFPERMREKSQGWSESEE